LAHTTTTLAHNQAPTATADGAARAPVVRWLVLIALVAFAGRSLYVLTVLQHEQYPRGLDDAGLVRSYDELYYTAAAHALADGDGFRFDLIGGPAEEQGVHPPMTSIVLAPVASLTDDELPMRLLVAAIGGVVVMLAGLVALSVAGPRAAYIAAVLAAIYPNLWMNDGLVLSESFAAAGTAAALWCTYRLLATWLWLWAMGAAVACALAMLSRSELALLLPAMFVPAVLLARTAPLSQRILHATVACVVAGLVVAPWLLYNLHRFEEPVLLSHGDGNVLIGANCDYTYHGTLLGFHDGRCGLIDNLPAELSEQASARRAAAFDYIGDHLDRLPVVVAVRVGRMWGLYGQVQMARIAQAEGRPMWASLAGLMMFWALVPVAALGARALRRSGRPLYPLLAPLLIVTFNAAAFYGITRFRVGAEVPLVVLAAVGIGHLVGDRPQALRSAGSWPPPVPVTARAGGANRPRWLRVAAEQQARAASGGAAPGPGSRWRPPGGRGPG
jgi:4-amino-4-deoxy-L-arabinose transferase-like glycosyltransferase